MMLNIDVAKKKICPRMSKPLSLQSSSDDWDFCCADSCMAWRWSVPDVEGYCGFVYSPELPPLLDLPFYDFDGVRL